MGRGGRRRRRGQKKTTAEAGGSEREVSNRPGQQASPANNANQGAIAARMRLMIGSTVTFLGGLVVVAQFFRDTKIEGDNVIRCLKQGAEICQSRPYNYFCDLMPFIRNAIDNMSAIIDNDMFLIVLYALTIVYIYYRSVQHP